MSNICTAYPYACTTSRLTCFFPDPHKDGISIQQQSAHPYSLQDAVQEPHEVNESHDKKEPTVTAVLGLLLTVTLTRGWPCLVLFGGERVVGEEPHVVLVNSFLGFAEAAPWCVTRGSWTEHLGQSRSLRQRNGHIIWIDMLTIVYMLQVNNVCRINFSIFTVKKITLLSVDNDNCLVLFFLWNTNYSNLIALI